MTVTVTWPQVLAWRMTRQFVDPVRKPSITEIADRLCGVQAQVASTAELAIRVRQSTSSAGVVASALGRGSLIRTWAMRGTLHLLTPEGGAALLAVIASARPWDRPQWLRYFGLTSKLLEDLRAASRDALSDGPLTREELIDAVTRRQDLAHVAELMRSGWGTLLKPLAWQGDLVFGPSRGTRVTFMLPEQATPRWKGLPPVEEAAAQAIAAYVGSYGPTTVARFGDWLSGGWLGKRHLRGWFEAMGDRLVDVEVEGEKRVMLAEHLDELAATKPSKTVRLLPGFDQYVLGPGTAATEIIAKARRPLVSKTAGWISPVVICGGVVSGTWELDGDAVKVLWFREAGAVPKRLLGAEVKRWASIVGRDLRVEVGSV